MAVPAKKKMEMRFDVVIEPGKQDGFVAHCPQVKGCWSQGDTIEETLENISEAVAGCLEGEDGTK